MVLMQGMGMLMANYTHLNGCINIYLFQPSGCFAICTFEIEFIYYNMCTLIHKCIHVPISGCMKILVFFR